MRNREGLEVAAMAADAQVAAVVPAGEAAEAVVLRARRLYLAVAEDSGHRWVAAVVEAIDPIHDRVWCRKAVVVGLVEVAIDREEISVHDRAARIGFPAEVATGQGTSAAIARAAAAIALRLAIDPVREREAVIVPAVADCLALAAEIGQAPGSVIDLEAELAIVLVAAIGRVLVEAGRGLVIARELATGLVPEIAPVAVTDLGSVIDPVAGIAQAMATDQEVVIDLGNDLAAETGRGLVCREIARVVTGPAIVRAVAIDPAVAIGLGIDLVAAVDRELAIAHGIDRAAVGVGIVLVAIVQGDGLMLIGRAVVTDRAHIGRPTGQSFDPIGRTDIGTTAAGGAGTIEGTITGIVVVGR